MNHLNDRIFLLINAGAHPPALLLDLALFLANWLVPAGAALFIFLWIRTSLEGRSALIVATMTMLTGLVVNQFIGLVYFHPRPFMMGLGYQYIPHPPDNSFPSDHATFLWSLGLALAALGAFRRWAIVFTISGIAVAWARIYVGVHFPFDMVGSLGVSLTVKRFTGLIKRPVQRWLYPVCVELYEILLKFLHLPPVLFPRQTIPIPICRTQSGPRRAQR